MPTARARLLAIAAVSTSAVTLSGGIAHAATTSLSYNFNATYTDAVGRYFADGSGLGHRGYIVQGSPAGGITLISHGTGSAAKFPAGCMDTGCRVIIETPDAPDLDPGSSDLSWGAEVLLRASEVTPGANVLQKGFSTSGDGMYKLQADGGKASCVLVDTGTTDTTIYKATYVTTIADSTWHDLRCGRTGTTLTLTVDGTVRDTTSIPSSLNVSNSVPLRLGGKNTGTNNDQFFGAIDNAFVRMG